MIGNPKISVLLPVYNAERYVAQAIESVLAQTLADFELIAVDDGSTDRSLEIMRSFDDPRIRVFHHENQGLPATLNRGAEYCRASYIARMDADDICKPDRFQKQYDFLETNPHSALVSGAVEYIDDEGVVLGRTYPVTNPSKIKNKLQQGGNVIVHPAVMMRRDVFNECAGYSDGLVTLEDHHLWMKFLRKGYRLDILPDILISYRISGGAISNWKKSDELIRLTNEILKHDNPPENLLTLFCQEVEQCKKLLIPQSQRTMQISNTLHCRIDRISRKLHMGRFTERIVCGLQNIFAGKVKF